MDNYSQELEKFYIDLAEKKNYLVEVPFYFNTFIREYDISKANASILLWKKEINERQFHEIISLPRMDRQILIGKMQKDKRINDLIQNGFKECRYNFFKQNQLLPQDILSVKNDAIFVLNKKVPVTQFNGVINFLLKNEYTSYMALNKRHIELYYKYDPITGEDHIDVKGINDSKLELHKKYFLDFLYFLFEMLEQDSIENTITTFNNFFKMYINRELEPEYYRTFNADSKFVVRWKSVTHTQLYAFDSVSTARNNLESLDISFNMNLLREIFSFLSNIYFNKSKR